MYSIPVAYLLWFLSPFGIFGLHRFYLGKVGSGLLWCFTGGFFLLGSVYDFFTLPRQVEEANIREHYRRSLYERDKLVVRQQRTTVEIKGESLERVILKTAKKNNGITSASEVALEGDISLETAKKSLEKLARDGFADIRVTKSGAIVYLFSELAGPDIHEELENF